MAVFIFSSFLDRRIGFLQIKTQVPLNPMTTWQEKVRKTKIFPLASRRNFQYTPLTQLYNPSNRRPQMAKKPMTKSQIVSQFAQKFELSKKSSAAILDEVAALAVSETKKNGSFTLPGIGKLVLVKRKARMGRNPATGAAIKIPAKTVVKMRIAKAAKEAIVPKKK
jgi:DNA-binding protein HU-beta